MARISLDDMGGGALSEKINLEFNKIARNIMDPNTDPTKKRKLTVTFTFEADEDRQQISTSVQTSTTLAPIKPMKTIMMVGKDLRTGRAEISEYGTRSYVPAVEVTPLEPDQHFDSETGEIYTTPKQEKTVRDLRA